MPTEEHNSDRPHQSVSQGVLAMMPPLRILATTVGAALLVCGLLFAYASSPAWAAIITVNSLADDADGADGECTLREAITAANTDTASGTATGECATGSGDDEYIRITGDGALDGEPNRGVARPFDQHRASWTKGRSVNGQAGERGRLQDLHRL